MKKWLTTPIVVKSIALLLPVVAATGSWAEQLEVTALYGKVPSELAAIFPDVSGAQAGKQIAVPNWRGWKTVYLSFNDKKRLASITFVPITPMSEHDAERLIEKEFSVRLPKKNQMRAPALVAYRGMQGMIKTVNLSYVDWKSDKRIGEIGMFWARLE